MAKKVFIVILIGMFLISCPGVEAAVSEPLANLINAALSNNPEILAAAKRYESAKARIPQAKSPDDPAIGIKFEKSKGNPFNLRTSPDMDRMLSVSQMIPWFGRLPLKGKIALVESQMYASEYKNKELEIINKVKNTYYGLFMNYKEVELKEESLQFLKNIARISEAKYVVGDIQQEDLFKINLEITRLSNDIANLLKERPVKETRLNSLLNRDPESPLGEPYMKEGVAPIQKETAVLYKLTLENQPELLVFSYAIERNKYAKDLAKKSYFPDIMAGIIMRGFTTGSIGPWDLMLAFTVPLWFWSKQRYQIKEAIANVEEAEAAYQAMKNIALAQTKELLVKTDIAANKIKLYRDNQIPLLESSISSSLSAYRSGQGDIMMLLDSQRMLIQAKTDYYESLVEYNMDLADLEKNVGVDLSEVKK